MKKLQVLLVEDNPADAALVLHELTSAGFTPEWSRVQTEADFLAALEKMPDIILSDYSMPQFSGLRALELLNASGLDIPLILISGTVGEDVAVEAMRLGAVDYLLKDRTVRLPSAVKRALKEKQSGRTQSGRRENQSPVPRAPALARGHAGPRRPRPGAQKRGQRAPAAGRKTSALFCRVITERKYPVTKPTPTKEETERLATLRNYGVLDTAPEKDSDDLVALAAHICDAPIALITFVDENRQWFKASFGLAVKETSRDVSFCAHAIHQPELFIVPDATKDERFADNPLVTGEPGIRFYAGSPLVAPDGQVLGTLCVMDRQPRQLTAAQKQALAVLSRHVTARLELRRQTREMTRANNALLGILEDARLAETALRESEELNRGVLNSMLAHIAVLDRDGNIIAVNDAWRQFARENSGNQQELLARTEVGTNYLEVCCASRGKFSEEAKAAHDGLSAVLRGEKNDFMLEYPCHGNGVKRWFLLSATPLKTKTGGAAVSHLDISERKLGEERIKHLNRVYSVLSDINQTIVREKDSQTMFEAACRITVDKGGFQMAWIGLVDAESQMVKPVARAGKVEDYLEKLNIVIRESSQGDGPTAIATKTGAHCICNDIEHDPMMARWQVAALHLGYRSSAAFPLVLRNQVVGTFNLYAGEAGFFNAEELRLLDELATDISFALEVHDHECQRQQAEQDLRVSEERFRQVVENIQEVFWITDPAKSQMLYISPAYETVWGRTCASLYKSPGTWFEAIHPNDRPRISQAAETKQVRGEYDEIYRILRPDGAARWIRDRAFPIRNAAGEIHRIVGVAEDITERKVAEQLTHRSQRLESIGTLAGGVAHDLNNALAPIMMGVEMLKLEYPKESETLEMFEACAKRGADLVRQLLSFAKGAEGEHVVLPPARLVRNLEKIMKGSFPKNIQLVVRCDPKLPTILGDPTQLDQVLLNLCVNARDAMPHGGTLSLEAERVKIDAAYASSIPDAKPGSYVVLRVRDTGMGIPPEIIDRIFDPFFTTKAPDKGTGLGLSTVMGIVKGHGGFLQVHSQPGKGATFAAYLPTNGASGNTEHIAKPRTAFRGQEELILFVDDEATVREIARGVLRRLN